MDPLDTGDAGELGGVFDSLRGTVRSIEGFGQAVGEATSFSMASAMIWAVIIFMFFAFSVRLLKPWNDGAAERWKHTGRVRGGPLGPAGGWQDMRIQQLEAQLAEAMARIDALTGATAPSREVSNVDR